MTLAGGEYIKDVWQIGVVVTVVVARGAVVRVVVVATVAAKVACRWVVGVSMPSAPTAVVAPAPA